jgi:hypothetical protein
MLQSSLGVLLATEHERPRVPPIPVASSIPSTRASRARASFFISEQCVSCKPNVGCAGIFVCRIETFVGTTLNGRNQECWGVLSAFGD